MDGSDDDAFSLSANTPSLTPERQQLSRRHRQEQNHLQHGHRDHHRAHHHHRERQEVDDTLDLRLNLHGSPRPQQQQQQQQPQQQQQQHLAEISHTPSTYRRGRYGSEGGEFQSGMRKSRVYSDSDWLELAIGGASGRSESAAAGESLSPPPPQPPHAVPMPRRLPPIRAQPSRQGEGDAEGEELSERGRQELTPEGRKRLGRTRTT